MGRKLLKLSLVFGVCSIFMPISVVWYWGNISVYALSYVVCMHPSDRNDIQTPWVISLFTSSWILFTFASNYMTRYIRRRWLIPLTLCVADLAVFSTYFAIQYSLGAMIVTVGLVMGCALGTVYGNALYLVVHSADGDIGKLISMVQGAFNFGGMIVSQIITWYVNPLNQVPTMEIGSTLYFTQKEVIDKVPSMFLVLGLFFLLTQLVGLSLLYLTPGMNTFLWDNVDASEKQRLINNQNIEEIDVDSKQKEKHKHESLRGESKNLTLRDFTPREVLRKPIFHCMWFSFLLFEVTFLVITNYFKIFGQIWIPDDHFLTEIGTAMLLACFVARISCGVLIDTLGVKSTTVAMSVSLVLVNCWFYFTPMLNRWLYFGAVILFGGCCACLYVCYLSMITVSFGKKHVSTNVGMMLMGTVVLNIFAPSLIESFLRYGWFVLFMSSAWLSAFNLILIAILASKM